MDKEKKDVRPNKINAWFRAFIDEKNPETFLNKTASARAAKYRAKTDNAFACIGHQNYIKLQGRIEKWMDEVGLSNVRLKQKLIELINAKEQKFFQKNGEVIDQREIDALDIQRKTLDMALKVKGLYKPERKEITGTGGKPIQITTLIPEPKMPPREIRHGDSND